MKIYKLHKQFYFDPIPLLSEDDLHIVYHEPTASAYPSGTTVYQRVEFVLHNGDVAEANDKLDYFRKKEFEGKTILEKSRSRSVDMRGRRTDEHKARATEEVKADLEGSQIDFAERKRAEIVEGWNERIKRANKAFEQHAMNVIPNSLKEHVDFEGNKFVEKQQIEIDKAQEIYDGAVKQLREAKKRMAHVKNEVFVQKYEPKDLYPEEIPPHIQQAVYSKAVEGEIWTYAPSLFKDV